MKTPLRRILFDPLKARIFYDLLVSTGTILTIYLTFSIFSIPTENPAFLVVIPLFYTLINYLYGLYSTYRISTATKKILIISYSGLTTLAISYLLQVDFLVSFLTIIFSVLFSSLARWMTNLPHQHLKSDYLNKIISSNQPILVVGGGGYIGSHVVSQLLNSGEKVRVFDKFYYNRDSVEKLTSNPNLEIIDGDISDLYSLTLALDGSKAVVHLAGIVGDPAAKIDKELTRHINIVTTRMLKETVKAFKIPRFIFSSSCSVYGSHSNEVDETSNLKPVSLYAQTKIDSEKELLEDPADVFNPTILRFATVFGHSKRMRFDLVANLFCAQAYHDGIITVFGGNQWRPFVHVTDVARSIVETLKVPYENVSREIFNVGDNKLNTTIEDLAHLVSSVIKKDKNGNKVKVIVNQNLEDPRNYNVSFDKINDKLEFRCLTNIEDGITEIYKNLNKNIYKNNYNDPIYSNYETTKLIHEEFITKEYREKHYSIISSQSA